MYRPASPINTECVPCKGLGSIDLSTMSWEDYALVGIGGAVFLSLWMDNKPKRRRRKKAAGSGITFAGAFPFLAVIAAGYVGYKIWSTGQSAGEWLATV